MSVKAAPLTPQVMLAFARAALQRRQPHFAWLLVVGFRTKEMLQLAPCDFTMSGTTAIIFCARIEKNVQNGSFSCQRLGLKELVAIQAFRKLLQSHRKSFMETWHSIAAARLSFYKPHCLQDWCATGCLSNKRALAALACCRI